MHAKYDVSISYSSEVMAYVQKLDAPELHSGGIKRYKVHNVFFFFQIHGWE